MKRRTFNQSGAALLPPSTSLAETTSLGGTAAVSCASKISDPQPCRQLNVEIGYHCDATESPALPAPQMTSPANVLAICAAYYSFFVLRVVLIITATIVCTSRRCQSSEHDTQRSPVEAEPQHDR